MCLCGEVLLNCVSTKIRQKAPLRQLLIGMSTSLYFPPSGTAGLARSCVRGKSRVPAPPPMMMARVLSCGVFSIILSSTRFVHLLKPANQRRLAALYQRALAALFRGKFLSGLSQILDEEGLHLPDSDIADMRPLIQICYTPSAGFFMPNVPLAGRTKATWLGTHTAHSGAQPA